jgi:hypothetical protein
MKRTQLLIFSSALFAATLGACSSQEKPKESAAAQAATEPLRVERAIETSVTATVKQVNYATREVTLADQSGNELTIVADQSVQRLNEVKVGDEVVAVYRATLVGELREPTAEERANPIVAVAAAGRAPMSSAPAGGVGTIVRVVTTVQAIDLPNMRVTLQGPMGDLVIVKARNKQNVERLKINDTIVITFSEAMAVSLEPAKK